MANEWPSVRLGDLISVKHGWPFQSEYCSEQLTGKPIVVSIGNFQYTGGFRFDSTTCREYVADYPSEYTLTRGDILLVMTCQTPGGEILGIPGRIPDDGRVYLHNQRMGKIVVDRPDLLRDDFVYWLFLGEDFNRELVASSTGTKILHTAPTRIEAFRFMLPSIDEQRAIARILGALDDKIELNRRMNKTLEEMASAIFKSWFVDFNPVVAKSEGKQPFGMSTEVAALFPGLFDETEDGSIPKGWRISCIGDEVRVVGGSTPSTGESEYWDGDIQWITPRDLSRLSEPIVLSTERKITQAGLSRISSGLLPTGTVLLSSRAPIGYLAIAEVPLAINQGFIAMVCSGLLPNQYVYHWTQHSMDEIVSRAGGTTFAEISKSSFRPIPVLVPKGEVLKAFADLVDPLHSRLVGNVQESTMLASLRDTLLPRLLSGEVRLNEAEKMVGAAV